MSVAYVVKRSKVAPLNGLLYFSWSPRKGEKLGPECNVSAPDTMWETGSQCTIRGDKKAGKAIVCSSAMVCDGIKDGMYWVTWIQKQGRLERMAFLQLASCLFRLVPFAKEPLFETVSQECSPPRHIKGLHFPWAKWHAHNRKELSKPWIIRDTSRREEKIFKFLGSATSN